MNKRWWKILNIAHHESDSIERFFEFAISFTIRSTSIEIVPPVDLDDVD